MDRIERNIRAKHARQFRKSIMKQRRNKRRLVTNQVNSLINETYGKKMDDNIIFQRHPKLRRNNKRTTLKNGETVDNRWVIPYNLYLVVKYHAHFNIECCNQGRDQDRRVFIIKENVANNLVDGSQSIREVDEIKRYLDCCYKKCDRSRSHHRSKYRN
ncbi:hypothetical protein M9H77_07810 [Catharanthus roseus]|uniref:Uncharacterized protein n=1 Tax=Catharanthus roseus TaxID=4058 RepID=A0ACC0BW72_CATRO|nr:hypothetical protein M9H77_07810 [Catharanthus roseus]